MAVYANKFTIEITDVARIIFVDERAPPAKGLPMPSSTATEVVVTPANLQALGTLINDMLAKRTPRTS